MTSSTYSELWKIFIISLQGFRFRSKCDIIPFKTSPREGLKKLWIYQLLNGWLGQDGDKIHKKHAFKIHFRPFLVILDQLFYICRGVGGSDRALSQAPPFAHICCHNPSPLFPPTPTTAKNTTHQPPLTPTATTHQSQPPLMPTTSTATSMHHCHHPPLLPLLLQFVLSATFE